MRRHVGIPAIDRGKPPPLGFPADILADGIFILEFKAVPARLPVHGMQLPTDTSPRSAPRMSAGFVG